MSSSASGDLVASLKSSCIFRKCIASKKLKKLNLASKGRILVCPFITLSNLNASNVVLEVLAIFIYEQVMLLGRLHHRNLVNLVGYCAEKGQHMLIYVYMSNGSLASHLYGKLAMNPVYKRGANVNTEN